MWHASHRQLEFSCLPARAKRNEREVNSQDKIWISPKIQQTNCLSRQHSGAAAAAVHLHPSPPLIRLPNSQLPLTSRCLITAGLAARTGPTRARSFPPSFSGCDGRASFTAALRPEPRSSSPFSTLHRALSPVTARSEMDETFPALATGQASTDAVMEQPMKVYIWDMDETLILLKSLLDGSYAGAFDGLKDREKSLEIGKRWENLILELCDEHFFYEEIENYNEPYLNALSEYDDGRDLTSYNFEADSFSSPYDDENKKKLAYRHRAIGEKYAKGLEKILDQHMLKVCNDQYNLTDKYTDGWLSSAHKLLEEALGKSASGPSSNSPSINFIVTSGSLIPSLAKCLLYRLDDVVSAENVYSSWEVGKLQCFKWIKERFNGPNVRFCAIGDGHEECSAAQVMKWPFIKIELHPDATHRFPGLDMPTVETYMDVIYGSSSKDG